MFLHVFSKPPKKNEVKDAGRCSKMRFGKHFRISRGSENEPLGRHFSGLGRFGGRVFPGVGPRHESVSILSRTTRPALAETELYKDEQFLTPEFGTFTMYFAT